MSLIAEIKRRNVFRVGVAYAKSMAWLLALPLGLCVGCFVGCVNLPTEGIPEYLAVAGAISPPPMNCAEPFGLERDCWLWWGPRRYVEIGGVPMKIAGSQDGTIILLAGPHHERKYPEMEHAVATNAAYESVKTELDHHGIYIVAVAALGTKEWLYGYLIETNREAYSILSGFSVD